ncbi:MAG: hypothetical protein KI793_09075 [Rivularia sp. (in: Bacteria)]|nr:hypothetical protein [Rivularia sp. MS3]
MTEYTLEVIFNRADLKLIYQAGQKVVLIKEVDGGGNKVVWVIFEPFQENKITWGSNYFLYASPTQAMEGLQIIGWTMQEAQAQSEYIFNDDKIFSAPEPNSKLKPYQYMVLNNTSFDREKMLTFGMAQTCIINGQKKSPHLLNATLVPAKQFAKFIPTNKVLIFLAANINDFSVHNDVRLDINIGKITSKNSVAGSSGSIATELDFSLSKEISVKYSASLGKFLQQ